MVRKRTYDDPMDVYCVRFTATHARKGRAIDKAAQSQEGNKINVGNLGRGLRALLDATPWPEDAGCPKRRAGDR